MKFLPLVYRGAFLLIIIKALYFKSPMQKPVHQKIKCEKRIFQKRYIRKILSTKSPTSPHSKADFGVQYIFLGVDILCVRL